MCARPIEQRVLHLRIRAPALARSDVTQSRESYMRSSGGDAPLRPVGYDDTSRPPSGYVQSVRPRFIDSRRTRRPKREHAGRRCRRSTCVGGGRLGGGRRGWGFTAQLVMPAILTGTPRSARSMQLSRLSTVSLSWYLSAIGTRLGRSARCCCTMRQLVGFASRHRAAADRAVQPGRTRPGRLHVQGNPLCPSAATESFGGCA